jgi:hypothetical protein
MSHIDRVKGSITNYFSHLAETPTYVRVLDTPRIWGKDFNSSVMEDAKA